MSSNIKRLIEFCQKHSLPYTQSEKELFTQFKIEHQWDKITINIYHSGTIKTFRHGYGNGRMKKKIDTFLMNLPKQTSLDKSDMFIF